MVSTRWRAVLRQVVDVAVRQATQGRPKAPGTSRRRPSPSLPARSSARTPQPRGAGAVTEYAGPLHVSYEPRADEHPDPGEIVWAWVPFEEGDGRGKDRPVLVVGRDGTALLALMLSSKDHDPDAADEARHGRHWVDVGSGPWDRQGRPSEVRVDRVLRIDPSGVRREGAALDRARFEEVAAEVRRSRG
jgi:PemK-like, MazF-like toxin of type II toxin-antitoxin system